eukprot:TRINITY_DN3748_c0_g1_i1.p3 TRINITY_DN3748_c0_g1~~TRINITY_DN3748_c0_g1_i1.p3  ORF type:complete len:52 (-),score=8.00 TRINITY_DN3748_c0_g1_i1:178-333(-)
MRFCSMTASASAFFLACLTASDLLGEMEPDLRLAVPFERGEISGNFNGVPE